MVMCACREALSLTVSCEVGGRWARKLGRSPTRQSGARARRLVGESVYPTHSEALSNYIGDDSAVGTWRLEPTDHPQATQNYSRAPDSPRITSHRIVLLLSGTVALEFGHGRQICMTMAQESRI